MFWRERTNRTIAFVDYEYWYISMMDHYHTEPDIMGWAASFGNGTK